MTIQPTETFTQTMILNCERSQKIGDSILREIEMNSTELAVSAKQTKTPSAHHMIQTEIERDMPTGLRKHGVSLTTTPARKQRQKITIRRIHEFSKPKSRQCQTVKSHGGRRDNGDLVESVGKGW